MLEFKIQLLKDFNVTEFLHKKHEFEYFDAGYNRAISVIRYWAWQYPNLLKPPSEAWKSDCLLGAIPDDESDLKHYKEGYDKCVADTEKFF